MIENNLIEFASRESNSDPLTELLRQCHASVDRTAVEAELAVFMGAFAERQCPNGRAAVVHILPIAVIGSILKSIQTQGSEVYDKSCSRMAC